MLKKPNINNMEQILKIKSISWIKKYLILVAWLKKTDFNYKISEAEGKIRSISGLATNSE